MDSEQTANLLNAFKNFRLGTKIDSITSETAQNTALTARAPWWTCTSSKGFTRRSTRRACCKLCRRRSRPSGLQVWRHGWGITLFCEYGGVLPGQQLFGQDILSMPRRKPYLSCAPADMGLGPASRPSRFSLATARWTCAPPITSRCSRTNPDSDRPERQHRFHDVTVTANGKTISTESFDARW